MAQGDTLVNAVLGAAVTVVLSFTGFSPILGGGVAGYLQYETRSEGARVGAISGALASVPLALLFVAVFGLLFGGLLLGIRGGAVALVVLIVAVPFVLVWNVGLGALGGYLGAYVREEHGGE